jgi:hypothetical protein
MEIEPFGEVPVIHGTDPFPYVVMDNVLPPEDFKTLLTGLPEIGKDPWVKYDNPLELKYALNKQETFPATVQVLLEALYSDYVCSLIPKMLELPDERLFRDPILLGAGIHAIPSGGKLDLHLDHNRNPSLENFERRVNCIYWMHPEWNEEWGGELELWRAGRKGLPKECVTSIVPKPNRLAMFRAGDSAWHGHPDPLTCPPGVHRLSLALYYYSNILDDKEIRHKVKFAPRPDDPPNAELDALRAARFDPARAASVWQVK